MHQTHYTISPTRFIWKGQTLWLSERRCLYWEDQKILILSDPHFGKSGHFRKEGIQVPQKVFQDDLHTFFEVIQFFKPEKVLVTGDLFHSSHNKQIDHFLRWRILLKDLPVILVKGNHDILTNDFYKQAGIEVKEKYWEIGSFGFTHDITTVHSEQYIFSGHIHPAVKLISGSKQALRLPCFSFGKKFAILPAFGKFTGHATIKIHRGDVIFGITEKEVIRLS